MNELAQPGILATAPDDFFLPKAALDQTVGWSSALQRPVSLREYIASRAPAGVLHALSIDPAEAPLEPVKRVTEMSDEELRHTVIAILNEDTEDSVLAVVGNGKYTTEELVREVERGTAVGDRFKEATAQHINLLEGFVESGRVEGLTEAPTEVKIDLDF